MSETTETTQAQAAPGKPVSVKKARKKAPITIAIVAAIVVVAGAGFWVWHEQPSFCAAICHIPMDPYLETYEEAPDSEGVDKWNNPVSNTNAMLAVTHASAGETCMSCHVPTLSEQVSEAVNWISGNYVFPLMEGDLDSLTEASGMDADEFCLKSGCHVTESGEEVTTREQLKELTADLSFNPHVAQHGERACSDCHKGHRASVMVCSDCHNEAQLPDGWITPDEEDQLIIQ
ncbi:MAG: cytochrome c3 family protein [Eggerthellaceae bacterium]|nr:cytochrome c3 family protein [Eggerthellaceae bacterium]